MITYSFLCVKFMKSFKEKLSFCQKQIISNHNIRSHYQRLPRVKIDAMNDVFYIEISFQGKQYGID